MIRFLLNFSSSSWYCLEWGFLFRVFLCLPVDPFSSSLRLLWKVCLRSCLHVVSNSKVTEVEGEREGGGWNVESFLLFVIINRENLVLDDHPINGGSSPGWPKPAAVVVPCNEGQVSPSVGFVVSEVCFFIVTLICVKRCKMKTLFLFLFFFFLKVGSDMLS